MQISYLNHALIPNDVKQDASDMWNQWWSWNSQCFTTNATFVGIKLKLTIWWDGF